MSWQQWLIQASNRLRIAGSSSAKCDTEILLSKVTDATRAQLLAFGETLLTYSQYIRLEELLLRREQGEPIAYIIGSREFWSLQLQVSPVTIIPRPDTECLVQCALKLLQFNNCINVLDLGTGTGAVALALASERSMWQIVGIDRLPDALILAHNNAIRLGIKNIKFLEGDWFTGLQTHRYTLIVSNPPYLGKDDPYLMQGDVRYEPHSALVAGNNGIQDLATISSCASTYLLPGGWLLLEHGYLQGKVVRSLLATAGFSNITTLRDYSYHERVTQGQWINIT